MELVQGYAIEFPPDEMTREAPAIPATSARVTNVVRQDDVPIYASQHDEAEFAIAEINGAVTVEEVFWPAMEDRLEGRTLLIRPGAEARGIEWARVRCRGGRYDGRAYSHVTKPLPELLTVTEHVGQDGAETYRRTEETDGGLVVFEHAGAAAPGGRP